MAENISLFGKKSLIRLSKVISVEALLHVIAARHKFCEDYQNERSRLQNQP